MRTAPLTLFAGMLLLAACSHRTTPPPPPEQPPLMAGEARFGSMSAAEQAELQQLLAPFLSSASVELWYSAARRKDTGTFEWCISPALSEAEWVCLGTMPAAELQKLAAERTVVEYGDTLDYWLRFELRSGGKSLPIMICPAEEFGVRIGGSHSVRSRSFHRAVWKFMDRQYGIQKRLDKIVLE